MDEQEVEMVVDPVAAERAKLTEWLAGDLRRPGESGDDYDERVARWKDQLAQMPGQAVKGLYDYSMQLNPPKGTVDTDDPERRGAAFFCEVMGKIDQAKQEGITGVVDYLGMAGLDDLK